MNHGDSMIRLEGVAKSFGSQTVLKNVNLEVQRGETVVLFGPSGAGKTLLLRLCMGLIPPDRGRIWVAGRDLAGLAPEELVEVRESCGMVFQYYALFDSMTVEDNIGFLLREHWRQAPGDIRRRVDELLAEIGLAGSNQLKPAELSGGMQRRVAIARAIAHQPKVVFYDSPTDGLDPVTAERMSELIVRLGTTLEVTALAISNDMATASRIGDRVGMLHDGEIIEIGPPGDVLRSKNPFVHQFVEGLEEGPLAYGRP